MAFMNRKSLAFINIIFFIILFFLHGEEVKVILRNSGLPFSYSTISIWYNFNGSILNIVPILIIIIILINIYFAIKKN